MEEQENEDTKAPEEKNRDWIILLVFVLALAAVAGAVWFFGWRANQYDIIKQEPPTIIYPVREGAGSVHK